MNGIPPADAGKLAELHNFWARADRLLAQERELENMTGRLSKPLGHEDVIYFSPDYEGEE